MIELPLFPLNIVLFPGMPQNLHIFEERYKLMINLCIQKRQPFGLVLIEEGVEVGSRRVRTHNIGCTAQITQVQPLPQSRMNITAIGRERFRILSIKYDQPYLVGEVEMYPLALDDLAAIHDSALKLRRLLERYLHILEEAGQVQYDTRQFPKEPLAIAYLASVVLQVSVEQKQKLLAAERATSLLTDLCSTYRREVAILEAMLRPPENDALDGPFSPN